MTSTCRRMPVLAAVGFVAMSYVVVLSPAVSDAAECGPGTFYDPGTNTCLVAAPPPPPPAPPPPPPAWNGDPTPGFSIGICAPIPFVSICTGI